MGKVLSFQLTSSVTSDVILSEAKDLGNLLAASRR